MGMVTTTNEPAPGRGLTGLLRTVALVALVVGAAVSLGFMLRAGRHQKSIVLIVMFAAWVASPFVALALADARWKDWPARMRATLHSMMLLVALGSVAIYADLVAWPPRPTNAFVYLVVPAGSWVLIVVVMVFGALVPGRRRGREVRT